MKSRVAVVKVVGGNIQGAVREAINMINPLVVKPKGKVVIKPNLVKPYEPILDTDVRVVEAVVQILKEKEPTCEILVAESDSTIRDAEEAFDKLGYTALEKTGDAKLFNFTDDQLLTPDEVSKFPEGKIFFSKRFLSCDHFISIAKLKKHPFERVTVILKNQWGCMAQSAKSYFHPHLGEILAYVNTRVRPFLCIVDGIDVVEGTGPVTGTPKKLNLLIVGKDPVAVDIVASTVMGINPMSAPHLRYAIAHGVGAIEGVEVVGEKLHNITAILKTPSHFQFLIYRLVIAVNHVITVLSRARAFDFIMGVYHKYSPEFKGSSSY